MAFNLEDCYGFGAGHNFTDYETVAGQVSRDLNSYALITDINANLITIDINNAYLGQFGTFKAGEVILIHASASPTLKTEKLGNFICAKIEVANAEKLTLDKDISATFDASDLDNYCIQAVTFAEFHCLKVNAGSAIQPQIYSSSAHHGGILAIKVTDKLTLNGDIDLTDCGISTYQKDYLRPLTDQEIKGTLDADELAGQENYCNNNNFLLNSGDGAAFIFAKIINADKNARIGNPDTHGKKYCRGAEDTTFKPSNITNVGGSSLLIVADRIYFNSVTLAKYRKISDSIAKKGKGLARCYIATQNYFHKDERLFHADIISDYARLSVKHNVTDFGTGKNQTCENPTYRLNTLQVLNRITNYSAEILLNNEKSLAPIAAGTKVLMLGVFPKLNEIIGVDGNVVTFKYKLTEDILRGLTVPEFENFTLTQNYYISDIFAVMVSNKAKFSSKINADHSFIFANDLEIVSGAWLGDEVMVAYKTLTGDLKSAVPEGSLTLASAN